MLHTYCEKYKQCKENEQTYHFYPGIRMQLSSASHSFHYLWYFYNTFPSDFSKHFLYIKLHRSLLQSHSPDLGDGKAKVTVIDPWKVSVTPKIWPAPNLHQILYTCSRLEVSIQPWGFVNFVLNCFKYILLQKESCDHYCQLQWAAVCLLTPTYDSFKFTGKWLPAWQIMSDKLVHSFILVVVAHFVAQ